MNCNGIIEHFKTLPHQSNPNVRRGCLRYAKISMTDSHEQKRVCVETCNGHFPYIIILVMNSSGVYLRLGIFFFRVGCDKHRSLEHKAAVRKYATGFDQCLDVLDVSIDPLTFIDDLEIIRCDSIPWL